MQRMLKELSLLQTCEFVKSIKTGEQEDVISSLWRITLKTDDLVVECAFSPEFPFEPPLVKIISTLPKAHPNIDTSGNICIDVLKLPPDGTWKPTYTIVTIVTALEMLLKEPNHSNPLQILPSAAASMQTKKKSLSLKLPTKA
jgi:ubiquitin-protein ligase